MTQQEILTNPMLLNLQMLADPMDEQFWEYTSHLPGEMPRLRSCLLYCGQKRLSPDVLYLIPEGAEESFPADGFCYITCTALTGTAPHLRSVRKPFGEVVNLVLDTFRRYHEFAQNLGSAVSSGCTLTELCCIASEFFHNPVYIHDHLFSIIGSSGHVVGMLDFEYNSKTDRMYIPLWLINEFKFDESYGSTLRLRQAGIWGNDQYPYNMRSLFVNLLDGEQYRGRILINEIGTSLQPGQFRAAEYLARYVIALIRSTEQNRTSRFHNFEETLVELASGGQADSRDVAAMMNILGWNEEDRYLCLRMQSQDPALPVLSGSALTSHLNSILTDYVDFRHQHQLCIVINLSRARVSDPAIRLHLAPFVRDSYMYGGISNPIRGIRSLSAAFQQAGLVLDYIIRENRGNWFASYSYCALAQIRERICADLTGELVAHPALADLKEYDAANGTQYYHTLRTYLFCERNIPATSETLIIHRTTLTYRLGKIQELIRINLDDPRLRLYLLLSFYLLEGDD